MSRFSARHNRPLRELGRSAAQALMNHRWPGNVRELEHAMEQAVLLSEGDQIEPIDLGLNRPAESGVRLELPDQLGEFHDVMEEIQLLAERELVHRALAETGGNRTQAASLLGIARRTLNYKLKRLDVD